MKESLEVKFRARLGPDEHAEMSIRTLKRIVAWTEEEINDEADQQHAEIICKMDGNNEGTKSVASPGDDEFNRVIQDDLIQLHKETQRLYRAMSARANYRKQDRTDTLFSAKEVSKGMA